MKLRPVSMDFNYGSSFGERSPTAYETLLLDAMIGDATLYTRQDMVEASWARGGADSGSLAGPEVRFSELRRGNLGPEGSRRDAGAARPCLEEAMSATIQPETILRELADLWVTLGKESDPSQSSGVLRACAMTLVTVVEESEDPSDVWSDDGGADAGASQPRDRDSFSAVGGARALLARILPVLDAVRAAPADLL